MRADAVVRSFVVAMALLVPARAWAIGIEVPCETPSVFSRAAVNVVVLPYSQPASLPGSAAAGGQLAALVHLEAVLAVAKFGSVGIVQLVGSQQVCAPDLIVDMLLGKRPGSPEKMQPGGGLVLIWGRIFESGPDLYLQTFVRFLRAGLDETIDLSIRDKMFRGGLATQAFACAPRKITVRDLQDVQRQYAAARLLHTQPDAASPVVALPQGRGPFSYSIEDSRGDWVLMQPMSEHPGIGRPLTRGWLLARAPDAQWSLRRQMPELYAVEGIAGYLMGRIRGDNAATFDATLQSADSAMTRYLDAWGANALLGSDAAAGGTPLAVAVPRQLRGFTTLLRGRASDASLAEARTQFERAATLVPQSSQARNLVTIVSVAQAYRQPSADRPPRRFIDDFRAQLGADPDNPSILSNLIATYDLLLSPLPAAPASWAIPSADQQQLTKQRDSLRAITRR
jgi:hypothetical protein